MWAHEALGAMAALALWWLEEGKETAWGQGLVALVRTEGAPTTPGEFCGNLMGIFVVFYSWGADDASPAEVAGRNVLRYVAAYGFFYGLFYALRLYPSARFSPEYPKPARVITELKWAACTVVIGICYDLVLRFHPLGATLGLGGLTRTATSELTSADLWLIPPIVLGVDVHFYLMHRAMHAPFLYKHVHSVHHLSRHAINPFSGFQFHPVEGLCYFSALPLVGAAMSALYGGPLHRLHYCVLKALLDFNPIWGHTGVGGLFGGSHHHFLHHTIGYKKHVNFGGTWLLDGLLGTGYVEPRTMKAA